jgi:hypothetical protein
MVPTPAELQIVQVSVADLRPDPANPRKISDVERDARPTAVVSLALASPGAPASRMPATPPGAPDTRMPATPPGATARAR